MQRVTAYDHGRGLWPIFSVAERIDYMERFVFRMIEEKDRVMRFLMWEVGKSLQDSEKEFDRTIKYINDTLAALKDLDRISSRFTIEEVIIGQIRRAPMGVVLCMGPFNYPLNETFTTLIPALKILFVKAAKQTDLNKQIITCIVWDHKSNFLATDFIV